MEFLKRAWLQARAFLVQLTPSQMWLIIALVIILGLSGFLVLEYAANAEMVPVGAFAANRQADVVNHLQAVGIKAEVRGQQIFVPSQRRNEVFAVLQQSSLMSEDTSAAFANLIAKQSPWMSNEQNRQAYDMALRTTLSQIIKEMKGIRKGEVFISKPNDKGFGSSYVKSSASVSVMMDAGRRLSKQLAGAIAGLVAGAVAELSPEDVVVIDSSSGRRFTQANENDIQPGETLDIIKAKEIRYLQKIERTLSYIPGVIVAVNVQTDPFSQKNIQEYQYEKSEPLRKQETRESERKNMREGGAPGVRPNTGLTIPGSSQVGTSETTSESRSEFGPKNMTRQVTSRESPYTTKKVNVTVNIPRSYFMYLAKQKDGQSKETPTNEQIEQIAKVELPRIESQIQPLISSRDTGSVRAHMIPDPELILATLRGTPQTSSVISLVQSPFAKPIGLGALALFSLALMFNMVRKSLQQPILPSVEELAGIPPSLPTEDDLVGEVMEDEGDMTGVEISDGEIKARKMAEQISDMIKASPSEAGSIFSRWVDGED